MKYIVLLFFCVNLLQASTSETIADIYDSRKISKDIEENLEPSSSSSHANQAPTTASQEIAKALDHAEIINKMADEQKDRMDKYQAAASVEMRHVNMSIDATVKVGTVKYLHSDLLSIVIQQELLYQEARLLVLQEEFNDDLEKEFK